MSVKRYEWVACDEHSCHCDVVESAEGDMVDYEDYAALEARCAALAAELSAVETIHNDAVFITDEHYEQCPPEVQKMIRSLAVMQIPAYQAFLAEVRAQAHKEGAHFVANRMLAAWEAGFIDDTAKNAADIARMILTSTEFMADAPEGDFDRSFADGVLEDIAAQLRKGVQS
ncbi:ead/Ea22-like family protein [Enterobacter kobei]|uniref:ead/Ea22-like family protein n=1 Tax=Enterobacter kobei TaxID=208224 RepID=UPI001E2C8F7C|nr:ead/Ea22-like family protein [Enterobacter kobei]